MKFIKRHIILVLFLLIGCVVWAQSDKKSSDRVNKAASELSKALDENAEESKIAADYEILAKELIQKKSYAKAEEYLRKALQIYTNQNQKEKVSAINREIAGILEMQGKIDDAVVHYEDAAKISVNSLQKQLNINDAGRVRNTSSPKKQSSYIQQNITLLEKENLPEEKAVVYQQMAVNSLQMNQKSQAIENYEKALENIPKTKPEAMAVQQKIAGIYISENKFDKAIDINENLLKETTKNKDVEAQIKQMQSLSEVYISGNKQKEGISTLKQAYELALKEGRTLDAKNCVELLGNIYTKENDYKQSISLYTNFLNHLEILIQSDSTLVDAKIFQLTEEQINRLEREKELKDKLIEGKNIFNTILIIFLVLLLFLLFLIIRAFYANKKKNKEIALQSLRREMNPHFIFNSLNSVNRFISQNNELEANKYLASYSRLMRNIMENSGKDFIKLSKELEQLEEYLQLEQLRFGDKFSYKITIDKDIDTESVSIPNMLIQPQLENAVWHGLRYKTEKGCLKLDIILKAGKIIVAIEDNGIGLTQSQAIKTDNQRIYESRGLNNVRERIRLLNELYHTEITLNIKEKEAPDTGVVVIFVF